MPFEGHSDEQVHLAANQRWLEVKRKMQWNTLQLAEILDVSVATLQRWESPTDPRLPSITGLLEFCVQSHTSPTWLLTGHGRPTIEGVDDVILKADLWDDTQAANSAIVEALEKSAQLQTHLRSIDDTAEEVVTRGDAMLNQATAIEDKIVRIDARSVSIEHRLDLIEAQLTELLKRK